MVLGLYSYWVIILAVIAAYAILGVILNKLSKYLASRYLKQGHFILALVCRCENNRVFLHHNIEMRPGYQGKFIEFHFHDEALG
jgi:hypothetical protein